MFFNSVDFFFFLLAVPCLAEPPAPGWAAGSPGPVLPVGKAAGLVVTNPPQSAAARESFRNKAAIIISGRIKFFFLRLRREFFFWWGRFGFF